MSLLFYTLSRFVIASFNFMAAVTIHSDFGTQENKVCHCFHCFGILADNKYPGGAAPGQEETNTMERVAKTLASRPWQPWGREAPTRNNLSQTLTPMPSIFHSNTSFLEGKGCLHFRRMGKNCFHLFFCYPPNLWVPSDLAFESQTQFAYFSSFLYQTRMSDLRPQNPTL